MPDTPNAVEFLRRRYARAIECGDARTATRLRAEIDRLINGAAARAAPAGPGLAETSWWQLTEQGPVIDYGDILGPHA